MNINVKMQMNINMYETRKFYSDLIINQKIRNHSRINLQKKVTRGHLSDKKGIVKEKLTIKIKN